MMMKEITVRILKLINFYLYSKNRLFITSEMRNIHRQWKFECNYLDFVRDSSLQLVSAVINAKRLLGCVAEVGVNRGDFALRMNASFPNRTLYLFDSFEGFPKKDLEIDRNNRLSDGKMKFQETSVGLVLSKMKHCEKVIIKKGYFPDTAKDIEDVFCFVSIDMDLYQPTLEGLRFFYPRLVKEGYMFVHDYNNDKYRGVRKAIGVFAEEQDFRMFPLSDTCGTAVLVK